MHRRLQSWIVRNRWSFGLPLILGGAVASVVCYLALPSAIGRFSPFVYNAVVLLFVLGRSFWKLDRYRLALRCYAALRPDEIPYADEINDPPDIGRVAREALGYAPGRRV